MDNLTYEYDAGNKLLKVADAVNLSNTVKGQFNDGNKNGNDYEYDPNGNMISDANKGITAIEYNHLNMPTKITVTGVNGGVLDYKYSADGIKLQKIKTQGGSTTTTDYIGNYVYENGNIKQITHSEGYVEPDGGGWQYVYRLTDIWGNTRVTFADDNNNGSVNSSEIRREQNFYPFGLEHKGYNGVSYGAKNNLKTYQKQEFTEDLGLNTHEWRYRVSDPAIGRFWQIDPLAEKYTYNSTYAFQENKLGSGIELEGLENVEWRYVWNAETEAYNPPIKLNLNNPIPDSGTAIRYVGGSNVEEGYDSRVLFFPGKNSLAGEYDKQFKSPSRVLGEFKPFSSVTNETSIGGQVESKKGSLGGKFGLKQTLNKSTVTLDENGVSFSNKGASTTFTGGVNLLSGSIGMDVSQSSSGSQTHTVSILGVKIQSVYNADGTLKSTQIFVPETSKKQVGAGVTNKTTLKTGFQRKGVTFKDSDEQN